MSDTSIIKTDSFLTLIDRPVIYDFSIVGFLGSAGLSSGLFGF